ncbi:1,3-beta-glucanosyltransferase gel1 [Aspergillus puulaauensis]|uniref:1,3-beta-glucanosyltransferase n=1 Tax=Aspergillus puulaauensis TaxID=1220207 RepID=A0A7R7XYQ8_9EURO|nr:beta-glucanosyltransferase [Aspergillus puulaauensis]BCS29942.1 beta-glucanosyltransferase [Aspergillus puulaauensis]
MKGSAIATALTLSVSSVLASPQQLSARDDFTPVTVKGNAFFKGDERFYMRGVDYQPGGSSDLADPIADTEGCKRDIKKFKELGLNTIRVYSVDNSQNHDECMNALADAGIHLVLDVNTPKYSINRKSPDVSYNDKYLQFIFATVDKFVKYKNTLAFFSGNEVINDGPSSITAPYVKAVTRDLRNYMSARDYRQVPVGYSAADVDTNRREMAEYMNCGTKEERSDFFAFNDYSWCSPSSFSKSGWDAKVKNFTGYGLPLFLSEYGCNTNTRDFGEVEALYSTKMTGVYSGGLVYEYSQEPSNYGLVKIKNNDLSDLKDFDALKSAFKKTNNPEGDGGYNKTGGANPCPARNAPNWNVDSEDTLPAMPEPAKKYFEDGAGDGPGFKGSGSQTSGTPSSSNTTDGEGNTVDGSVNTQNSGSGDDDEGAAAGLQISPVFVGMVTIFSSLVGAGMALF